MAQRGSFPKENHTASSLPQPTITNKVQQQTPPSIANSMGSPSHSTSASSSVPSRAVAELLEVAQRRSSINDDDDDDDNSDRLFPHQDEYDVNLSSLQVPKLPSVPDELDRKRFLGCLASIVAARYRYDVDDLQATADESMINNSNSNDYYEEYLEDYNSNEPNFRHSGSSDSLNNTTHSPTRRRTMQSLQHSQEKHRQRRYHVYCDFLSNAALYLDLDPNHSKCFLPMLSQLLHAQPSSSSSNNNNTAPINSETNRYTQQLQSIDHLDSFLCDLTPGAGLQCLTMFLTQLLLHAAQGYDARIRVVLRQLGVFVIWHDNPTLSTTQASRKFEHVEQEIAAKLIALSLAQQEMQQQRQPSSNRNAGFHRKTKRTSRDNLIRGLKIGGTAVAAGTLFAITGGLAAPGIAAGVAALAGTTAVAAVLTSTAAVTTIFGVGGGGLVAYKMNRRVAGLTEFTFVPQGKSSHKSAASLSTDLFSTICISGWVRDDCDYQRPWGVDPSRPPIVDRLELLERFYSVYRPGHIPKCKQILQSWKDQERDLWELLRENYGTDPDHLFPLEDRPRDLGNLTPCEQERMDELFVKMGCVVPGHEEASSESQQQQHETPLQRLSFDPQDNLPRTTRSELRRLNSLDSNISESTRLNSQESILSSEELNADHPKHLATVWDYQGTYGGEQYTVRWESQLLEELYDSVADLAADVLTGATAHMLKYTALSALASAVALPVALITAASMLDGTWTLAARRADEAGKELAKSLIFSSAGNRPVTLVGYSFGARVIYSCLKELSRLQVLWEEHRDLPPRRRRRGNQFDEQNPEYFAKMREPASIVSDAILMGLPNHLSPSSWKAARQVVAGRLVHCFSQRDMILMLMFQIKKFGLKSVCGTVPVSVGGVENVDVTDIVQGHHQHYCMFAGEILNRVRHGEPFQADATGVVLEMEAALEDQR